MCGRIGTPRVRSMAPCVHRTQRLVRDGLGPYTASVLCVAIILRTKIHTVFAVFAREGSQGCRARVCVVCISGRHSRTDFCNSGNVGRSFFAPFMRGTCKIKSTLRMPCETEITQSGAPVGGAEGGCFGASCDLESIPIRRSDSQNAGRISALGAPLSINMMCRI